MNEKCCDNCKWYEWCWDKCKKWDCECDEREVHSCFEPRENQGRTNLYKE